MMGTAGMEGGAAARKRDRAAGEDLRVMARRRVEIRGEDAKKGWEGMSWWRFRSLDRSTVMS